MDKYCIKPPKVDKIINKLVYLGGNIMKKYRKKIALLIVMVFVFSIVMLGIIRMMDSREVNAEEISDKVIRFHVLANSDSDEDQNLKIKVKNNVIKYMYDKLNGCDDIDKSREMIR